MKRTKAEMRRMRKELRRQHNEREAKRINIPIGLFLKTYFDRWGNEYWYDGNGRVCGEWNCD